jgi:hypothetical protein
MRVRVPLDGLYDFLSFSHQMRERLGTVEDRSDVKEASEMIGVANEFRERIKKTEKAYDKYAKSFKGMIL